MKSDTIDNTATVASASFAPRELVSSIRPMPRLHSYQGLGSTTARQVGTELALHPTSVPKSSSAEHTPCSAVRLRVETRRLRGLRVFPLPVFCSANRSFWVRGLQ